jgi:hypothetical protein
MYFHQNCFKCRPSDFNVSEDAGFKLQESDALTTRLDHIRKFCCFCKECLVYCTSISICNDTEILSGIWIAKQTINTSRRVFWSHPPPRGTLPTLILGTPLIPSPLHPPLHLPFRPSHIPFCGSEGLILMPG